VRIYQVDECQNVYMARIFASGHASEFFTNASLFLLGPLSWITRTGSQSKEIFSAARLLFLGIFWLNLLLLAAIASGRLASCRGLIALVFAATLAPLWDYGFEIRHDNVMLTGVMLTWWAVRTRLMGLRSYVLAGFIAVTLLFIAFKSAIYVLPLSFAILTFPPSLRGNLRWRLALGWAGGALLAGCLIRLCYGRGGGWETYLSLFHGVARDSTGATAGATESARWATLTLGRLLGQTPLLLALTTAAFCAVVVGLWRYGRAAFNWETNLPEALLVAGSLGALMVNPTPYPYNLLNVVPYAFIFSFRYLAGIWNDLWGRAHLRPLVAAVLVFANFVPFGLATRRHLDFPNFRQEKLMTLAENLTDPKLDAVYDGIGMIPTRSTINFHWYLHGLNIQSFINKPGSHVRDMLAARPAAVLIPSYRTDWLPEADHEFIRQHYVSLADDFWVLGKMLPPGGGTFEVIHAGRYRISSAEGSDLAGTYPEGMQGLLTPEEEGLLNGTIDGAPISNRPVLLMAGPHRIECSPERQPAVVWIGPKLERVHRLGPSDHGSLFVNWY
jgi:hypothetical protein